ncbi:leucine-rich repeat domain-containing protein [Lachnospiraceae bacterium OttesenSCG-928-D06]|nr:leucine-rich repeat domain-containing protein [Lachnospiraceae bacterium OttesenSCG-928-D06]
MKKCKSILVAFLAIIIVITQISITMEAEAFVSASDFGNEDGIIGSTSVVGNQAVILMDNDTLSVYGGSATGTGSTGGNVSEHNGRLSKYAIVEGKIVADQAYYNAKSLNTIMLPDTLQEIGMFAFARSGLLEITVPKDTKTIGYGAFYHCDNLFSVTLSDSIMNVEPKAFLFTAFLKDFFENSQEDYLISGGVLLAYKGSGNKPVIPEGVRVIAGEVFSSHTEIEEVTLPESLRVIGEAAFSDCINLSVVHGGNGVTQIKDRAFFGCPLGTIKISASVEEIGLCAFDYTQTQKDEASKVVFFSGKELPKLSYEVSGTRLSNKSYRQEAFLDTIFAIVDSSVTLEALKNSVLFSDKAAFSGVIGSLSDDGTFKLRYSTMTREELLAFEIPEQIKIEEEVYEITGKGQMETVTITNESTSQEQVYISGTEDFVSAELTEEGGAFNLNVMPISNHLDFETAYKRAYQSQLTQSYTLYDLSFLDANSNLPITILGKERLNIEIKVSEGTVEDDLQIFSLDRNGQLKKLDFTLSVEEGNTLVRVSLSNISVIGIIEN